MNKIKLFQVLGNLFANAKEALLESSNEQKELMITTKYDNKDKIKIQISENGIGILKENLNKIFVFGFTTKKSGHGFGLHASALALNQMGGEIRATSEVLDKGSTFDIYLPNRRASPFKKTGVNHDGC